MKKQKASNTRALEMPSRKRPPRGHRSCASGTRRAPTGAFCKFPAIQRKDAVRLRQESIEGRTSPDQQIDYRRRNGRPPFSASPIPRSFQVLAANALAVEAETLFDQKPTRTPRWADVSSPWSLPIVADPATSRLTLVRIAALNPRRSGRRPSSKHPRARSC